MCGIRKIKQKNATTIMFTSYLQDFQHIFKKKLSIYILVFEKYAINLLDWFFGSNIIIL